MMWGGGCPVRRWKRRPWIRARTRIHLGSNEPKPAAAYTRATSAEDTPESHTRMHPSHHNLLPTTPESAVPLCVLRY